MEVSILNNKSLLENQKNERMSMQITGLGPFEHVNEKKARIAAGLGLAIIIFALLIPLFTEPDPPPGQAGILINLGEPDVGQGEENGPPPAAAEEVSEVEESEPVEEEIEEVEEEKPAPRKPEKTEPKKEVVKTEDPGAVALRKRKEREAQAKADAQAKAEREAREQKRKADAEKRAKEEAKRKAEAARAAAEAKKKAEADALKDALGGAFGGSGSGKGNTGTSGNEGRSDGDPSGLGSVGGGSGTVQGFGDRGFNAPGALRDDSQSTGKVYVKICVDASGRVISAKKTLAGTTATDTQLHRKAEAHAKKYKFKASSSERQCGTIVYDFKFRG